MIVSKLQGIFIIIA